MRFVVKFRDEESVGTKHYPHAVLVQDNWDDYGYRSTFRVYLYTSVDEEIDLGNIKIIQAGSAGGYTDLPREPFERLSKNHASLGSDLNYYETLYKLGRDIFRPFLEGLRDVAFSDDAKAAVEDTEGYRVSCCASVEQSERSLMPAASSGPPHCPPRGEARASA